jgi:AAA15 family ATPase/GTPase
MIERLRLENFTAFRNLDVSFSPGINIFVGENGTGKTHVLKVLYSFLTGEKVYEKSRVPIISHKILNNFMPYPQSWDTIVKKGNDAGFFKIVITIDGSSLTIRYTIRYDEERNPIAGPTESGHFPVIITQRPVFIPVKEMLANAPGFRSLYKEREVYFEQIYDDVLSKAFLPKKREITHSHNELCKILEGLLGGNVYIKDEHFFVHGNKFDLEFSLLAEGLRKLGLLWVLLQNGSLDPGSVLFWDEPEANMNPSLLKVIIEVLLELQRNGVQIFIATHNYIVLKEFDLQKKTDDHVRFFSFSRAEDDISVKSGENYLDIVPNKITEAYTDVYNNEIRRSLGGNGGND